MDVLKTALKTIKPTKEEEKTVSELVDDVILKLSKKTTAAPTVGGSVAKGTWLASNKEIDIFVLFDKDNGNLSDQLETSLNKAFKGIERVHGSRDYFQLDKNGFVIEFIPILKIPRAEDAANTTDISMLHVGWVKKHGKKYTDDIRLLKQFAKAQGVYGAESHIMGVSGYVLEILCSHYGGFMKTIKEIAKWSDKKVIDINKVHRNVHFSLNKSKLMSPLILVDPVDDERNAAAALSVENYKALIKVCKSFLKNPSADAFVEKPFDMDALRKKHRKNLFMVSAAPLEGRKDVVGCKVLKAHQHILKRLEPFGVQKSGWAMDEKAYLWYVLKDVELSDTIEVEGPPTSMKDHAAAFRKKHSKTKEVSGKLIATVDREFTTPDEALKQILKDAYLKNKAKRFRNETH